MRLLYQHVVQSISKNDCQVIIDDLKSRVATSFKIEGEDSKRDAVYRFLTTSRPVETWLQNVDDRIKIMSRKKVPFEFWMVTGGYGAGKSHIKEFLRRNEIEHLKFLEPDISFMARSDERVASISSIFSVILLETKPFYNSLYDSIKEALPTPSNGEEVEEIKKAVRDYSIDDDFIDAFCTYANPNNSDRRDFRALEELIIEKGEQLFLPLMKLFKDYLSINAFCIFIDEFESLQFLDSKRLDKFIQSIRPFYDTIASTISNHDLPSFKTIVLCTYSYWNDLTRDERSQALESRVREFEIPPLVEDEIKELFEKIYMIYTKSDYQVPEIPLNINEIQPFLINKAGIDAPLTPRFVISEILSIIEEPNDFLERQSQL